MTPYLPPYQPPGYDQSTGLNTGNLGFMTLPVERTSGGFENNIWNPNANPFPTGAPAGSDSGDIQNELGFNPFTQGYMSDGVWRPYLPGKIVYGQNKPTQPPVGPASQIINGQPVNIGANNYAAGASTAAPYQYATAPGDARMETAATPLGFGFGEVGKPGYSFMAGSLEDGKFYSKQPDTLNPTPNKNLGVLQPWNPALSALQQSRSQP